MRALSWETLIGFAKTWIKKRCRMTEHLAYLLSHFLLHKDTSIGSISLTACASRVQKSRKRS